MSLCRYGKFIPRPTHSRYFEQARVGMKKLESKAQAHFLTQNKRLRDAKGKINEGAKKLKEGYAAIKEGAQFLQQSGDIAREEVAGGEAMVGVGAKAGVAETS